MLWRSLINRHRTWYFLGNFVKFFRQFYHGIRYSGCFLYGDITKYRNEVNFKFVPTTMKRNKLDLKKGGCIQKIRLQNISGWLLVYPANIYLLKVNNRNTRKRCEICSKLTMKTPERRHWHLFLVFLLLTLNKYMLAG